MRDIEELAELGLPIWARVVSIRGATKVTPGTIDEPVTVGGQRIEKGDAVVLDADGAAVVPRARFDDVLAAALAREESEQGKRELLRNGELTYDLLGLRERVEGAG